MATHAMPLTMSISGVREVVEGMLFWVESTDQGMATFPGANRVLSFVSDVCACLSYRCSVATVSWRCLQGVNVF